MKVCILGSGLVSLTLAKALLNQGIYVDILLREKVQSQNKSRTLGISETNVKFINKNVSDIKKYLWGINKIEIFSEKLNNKKILNFENKDKKLFSLIRNNKLYNHLINQLKKNKLFKFKTYTKNFHFLMNNYGLIVNCDLSNPITKKYFYNKLSKNYNSYAHTTIIKHKKLSQNNTAVQIFTKKGPLAFLPISETETSVVYSARGKANIDLKKIIRENNMKYSITKIENSFSFELKSSNLRSYYYKNILAFGDLLHKLHPLAGQGFNMSLRDIEQLLKLIKSKLDLGLELDSSICSDFEKKTKHKNYIFLNSIDFVYEFFNLETKFSNNILSKSVKLLGKNKFINKFFTNIADNGIQI